MAGLALGAECEHSPPVMTFRFLHTADWQIGKPFQRFDDEVGALLRQERLAVVDRIAELARRQGIRHVFVAGDVWDSDQPSDRTLRQSLEVLKSHHDIDWWLLPGNHDPHRARGLWHRLGQKIGLSSNVHMLLEPKPVGIEPGVTLLPAPWTSKNPGRDITMWMNEAETPAGALRIGLAHGGTKTFGGDSPQQTVIAHDRARQARLDYLALGDWHGKVQVDERSWYSGTPEPDSFQSKDPGWCLSVAIAAAGAVPQVEAHRTGQYAWFKEETKLVPGMAARYGVDADGVSEVARHKTLLRLSISGHARLSERAELAVHLEVARNSFFYFEADVSALATVVGREDLDQLALSGPLRQAAGRLSELADSADGDEERRQDAVRALDLLFSYARVADTASKGGESGGDGYGDRA